MHSSSANLSHNSLDKGESPYNANNVAKSKNKSPSKTGKTEDKSKQQKKDASSSTSSKKKISDAVLKNKSTSSHYKSRFYAPSSTISMPVLNASEDTVDENKSEKDKGDKIIKAPLTPTRIEKAKNDEET